MKGLILYRSTYGSTEQYARWISEETGYELLELGKQRRKQVEDSDVVIVGAPVMAGQSAAGRWIVKNWPALKDKKVVLFTTSGADPDDPEILENYRKNIDSGIRDRLTYVPLGGRIIVGELKPLHRFLMRLGQRFEKDESVRENMGKDVDRLDRRGIEALVRAAV